MGFFFSSVLSFFSSVPSFFSSVPSSMSASPSSTLGVSPGVSSGASLDATSERNF